MRVKGTYRKRERKSESIETYRKERKGWKELNRERVDEGEGCHGARLHTQFHKKSDQSTYIYIAWVLLSGPALSHFLSPSLSLSLFLLFPYETTPIQTSHRVRLGVGIYDCQRPFYFVAWYAAAFFLPCGLPMKRSPRI